MNETPSINNIIKTLNGCASDLDFWLNIHGVVLSAKEHDDLHTAIDGLANLEESFDIARTD
jgi:hypothetical protein